MTDAQIKTINDKLAKAGSNFYITPQLSKDLSQILPKSFSIDIAPNKVAQEALDEAIKGKVMRAEVMPLADKLKESVVSALKDLQVPLNGVTVPPEKITAAVTQALTSANFTSLGESAGDALAKGIAVKVSGEKYYVNVSAKTENLVTAVNNALAKIEQKERKIKLDKQSIKEFKDELAKALGEKITVTPTVNLTQDALQRAAEGKVMKVEITPLLTHLRRALLDATSQAPAQIEVGIDASKLRNLITRVLNLQGYMVNISAITGVTSLEKTIQAQLNGRVYDVKIRANANEITQSVQASLMQIQSRHFGLEVSKDVLRNSIDTALMGKPFQIQIAVMHDQARRAVQNALNNARMVGKDDALAYQRLQTGELKAAQAELARLRAAHMSAADAAKTHASASLNLGGALGSNIRIAGELGSAMASLYSIHAAKEFLSQVIEIGGELEHQKIAMDTIFGDKGKTSELFGQIKGLARQSPFGVMELTKSVKALSAYGVEYNEIYDTAKRLADISAATSIDINRLILAFGKTKSRGFLDGLEAKQFAYANIPIYEMVRKKLEELEGQAVTTAEVMARMKKREIGFDIVKDVLWDITDEGGKFYNMQEALAGSVKTSWKLVRDNIELMFGEIAESPVGDGLKDLAQILQGLTRNWRTLAVALGVGATAFGLHKIAVAASNQMMGLHNAEMLKSVTAENLAKTAKIQEIAIYRTINAEENEQLILKGALAKLNRSLLLSHKALTEAEWDTAIVLGKVNEEFILRRIAMGRVTQAEYNYLVASGAVNSQLAAQALAASQTKISLASLWITIKAGAKSAWVSAGNFFTRFKAGTAGAVASMRNLNFANTLTWIKTLPARVAQAEVSVTRLKLALSGLGRTMASIGSFLINPATLAMAAIGGAMYAWERNNEEMQKAKEIGDNLFTKATEGADNLKKTLADIKPSEGLSNHALLQGIEQMEQAIKDYSPTPIEDINDALYTQDGLLRPIADRYDELKKKVEELKGAFDSIESANIGDAVENAINDTNKGVFDDDINTNVQDYANALKKQEDAIRQFASKYPQYIRKAAADARAESAAFRTATEGMADVQAISHLVKNLKEYESLKSVVSVNNVLKSKVGSYRLDSGFGIESAKATLLEDMQAFWDSIRTDAQLHGIDAIEDASEETKKGYAIAIKNWIKGLEVPEELKQMMFNYYSNLLKFDFESVNASETIAKSLNDGLEAEVGSAIFQKVKNGIKLTDEEQEKVNKAFQKIYAKLYEKLPEVQKAAFNNAVASEKDGTLHFDSKKMMSIQAQLNVRANWEEWQREIDDATGNLKPIQSWIQGKPDVLSFVKSVQEGYAEAQTKADKLKLMLKGAVNFDFEGEEIFYGAGSLLYGKLTEYQKSMIDQWNETIRLIKAAKKAGETMGFDPAEEYNKKKKSSKNKSNSDPFADAIKERITLLKKAKSEYESLVKSIGAEEASKKLANSPIFAGLKANEYLPEQAIPKTLKDYEDALEELQKKLTAKGLKTKKHRELNVEIEQVKFEIDKAKIDGELKAALDKVSKEAERQLADWDLFDKIRNSTGNQDLAVAIAFGVNANPETDYPAMIKQQFENVAHQYEGLENLTFDMITDEGQLKGAPEEVVNAYKEALKQIEQYARAQKDAISEILKEYQSIQEKIGAINFKRNKEIEQVNRKDDNGDFAYSEDVRKKLIERINAGADYEIFQQSDQYMQFFSSIFSMARTEGENAASAIQLHLNRLLQAGKLTIDEYSKEVARVTEQINKLRFKKSNFMTVATEGKNALLERQIEEERGRLYQSKEYNEAISRQLAAQAKLREDNTEEAQAELEAANKQVDALTASLDKLYKQQNVLRQNKDLMTYIAREADSMASILSDVADTGSRHSDDPYSSKFSAMDATGQALSALAKGMGQISDALSNDDYLGAAAAASSLANSVGGVFDTWKDDITDQKIKKSVALMKSLQNVIDDIGRAMEHTLGHPKFATDFEDEAGAYGQQLSLMEEQLDALNHQRDLELYKKSIDPEAVEEYNAQIKEMQDQIKWFAEETAKDLYDIDLKDWAAQLGDALYEAWQKGEDGAEAFRKKAGELIGQVMNDILRLSILEPMMQSVSDYLFGTEEERAANGGKAGAFGTDFELSPDEVDKIAGMIMEGMEGVDAYNSALEALEETLKEKYGLSMKDTDSTSSSSAGIQSLSEDTGGLIASYLNAIRADVSEQVHIVLPKLFDTYLPQMNVIAEQQLSVQQSIAANTLRNAMAAEAIADSNNSIYRILRSATQGGSKFYIQ